jgi:hypothetical protein
MSRIKHNNYGGRAGKTGSARMSVITHGKYLSYYPSAKALAILDQWPGIELEWDIDDTTRKVTVHLTPAEHGGLPLRKPDVGSPFVNLPTDCIGTAVKESVHKRFTPAVAEVAVTEAEVAVSVPFSFQFNTPTE